MQRHRFLLHEKFFAALRSTAGAASLMIAFFILAACSLSGPDIEDSQFPRERTPKLADMPTSQETVRGKDDPPIVTLQLEKELKQTNLRPSEELPERYKIGTTNLNNVPLATALQAVMADTDIPLLWEDPELQARPVTLMNLKGPLPIVMDRICRAAKIICAYRNGALELMAEDTFVVALPGIAGTVSGGGAGTSGSISSSTTNTITESIEALISGKVKVDSNGGNLIYTTNAEGHERVQSYLEQLRNGRPLIMLQLYIWEVQLEDNKQLGINWKNLQLPKLGDPASQAIASTINTGVNSVASGQGISLGAVFSGAIDANTLVGFLSKQGKVQNISSPQLTFVSGSSARFEIGGKQRYIAQIGTQNTVAGTSNTANSVVTTEELKTGLTITANGTYEGGVVFSTLELKTADLVTFQEFPAGTVNLKLPQTSDRTVQTVLRVRPGDNLVLAGLQTTRDERAREGLPTFVAGDVPLSGSNRIVNSELVILVRPAVVFFNDHNSPDLRKVSEKAPLPKPEEAKVALPVEAPRPANPLQNEFGTVVKLYEDTHGNNIKTPAAAKKAGNTPPVKSPQNILPDKGGDE